MRTIIQRVSNANVVINGVEKSKIGQGLLVLCGFENEDNEEDIQWMAQKILKLRIFEDEKQLMNLSVQDIKGELLVISQFTLHAKTKKGNRPSFIGAAKPDVAIPLYNSFIEALQQENNTKIQTGEFGADMKVTLTNDGPVTISIDTKNKE